MRQLVAINAVIIVMDLGLLGLEAASLYILQVTFKGGSPHRLSSLALD